jgi:hypothetical protein
METHEPRISGVFPHLVNSAAFMDKVEIQAWGEKRTKVLNYIAPEQNRAIGGFGRVYGRCIPGVNTPTGNSLQFKYGVMLPYRNISPFVLLLRAERTPVTCADVLLAMEGFLRSGCRAKVTRVEVTFDTTGIQLERFTRELCTAARAFREIEGKFGSTIYVGGANSPWQLRAYQKTYRIVRVEFMLRSTFLRNRGIVRPKDLSLLRRSRLWDLVTFREVNQSEGAALPPRLRSHWAKLGHGLPPDMPASIIRKALRESRIDPSLWVVRSQRETLLRNMQTNLIW